ncbi:hypothetical protein SteCoe_2141 [Stentor coeruleus]|uniref:Uncharacterized protein n=1 Tax=Stentor coeruleus TaxID=5963 RepID=A0A1R2D059_9CILI|nr:hypothetical protein SteCoe_2141 [Stentor coeruleus]
MELKSPDDTSMRRSVFITDMNKSGVDPEISDKINEYFSQLQDHVGKLDTHIDNVLHKHENDFLNAFKCQMFTLYTQLRELKKKTDENEVKLRRDEQLNKLQASLDWFREEAVHLGETTQFYKKEADKWKAKADSLEDDRKFLEDQLRCAKKRIKDLQEGRSQENTLENSSRISRPMTSSGQGSQKFIPTTKSGLLIMELLQKHPMKDGEFFFELEKYLNNIENAYHEALKKAKFSLSYEKKKHFNVSAQQTSVYFEKSEMENLFLECVDEVRKDVLKRRTQNMFAQKYTKRAASSHRNEKNPLTSSDKRKILELLVSNEQILILLYEKLFPHKAVNYNLFAKNEDGSQEPLPSIDELIKQVPTRLGAKTSTPQKARIFGYT